LLSRDSKNSINPVFPKKEGGISLCGAGNPQVQACSLAPTGSAFKQFYYGRAYRAKNSLKVKLAREKWRKNNKDKILAYRKTYCKKNSLQYYLYQKRIGAAKSKALVCKAVKNGLLISLSKNVIQCTDCNNRATCYDHRDYNYPLDVEPVCVSCNNKRGAAIPVKINVPAI